MFTYKIYHDDKLKKEFKDQETDVNVFGYMLRIQGNSVSHALKYEGWKINVFDQETGKEIQY